MLCTFSEIEVPFVVVTHVAMKYFAAFMTDNISYLTFVHPIVFQNQKNNHSVLKTESLSILR
jgi:hypothetical protein